MPIIRDWRGRMWTAMMLAVFVLGVGIARGELPHAEPLDRPASSQEPAGPQAGGVTFKPIGRVRTNIAPPSGVLPEDAAGPLFAAQGVIYQPAVFPCEWPHLAPYGQVGMLCHRPLYFEDVALERYGHSFGWFQPLVSAGHFYATVPLLPYKMTAESPHHLVCTAGRYPPGVFPPPLFDPSEFRLDAALVQAATVAGVILLFP